jgi:hypothetical protein
LKLTYFASELSLLKPDTQARHFGVLKLLVNFVVADVLLQPWDMFATVKSLDPTSGDAAGFGGEEHEEIEQPRETAAKPKMNGRMEAGDLCDFPSRVFEKVLLEPEFPS